MSNPFGLMSPGGRYGDGLPSIVANQTDAYFEKSEYEFHRRKLQGQISEGKVSAKTWRYAVEKLSLLSEKALRNRYLEITPTNQIDEHIHNKNSQTTNKVGIVGLWVRFILLGKLAERMNMAVDKVLATLPVPTNVYFHYAQEFIVKYDLDIPQTVFMGTNINRISDMGEENPDFTCFITQDGKCYGDIIPARVFDELISTLKQNEVCDLELEIIEDNQRKIIKGVAGINTNHLSVLLCFDNTIQEKLRNLFSVGYKHNKKVIYLKCGNQ